MKPTGVRLIADGDFKLTPEEYLELKEQLIEQLDKFLGPRIEKLS